MSPSFRQFFTDKGFDCIHTLDLEQGNDTPDKIISQISISEQRILITKDSDFFDGFIIKGEPYKLILVKLGNTSKKDLIQYFHIHFEEIIEKINVEEMVLLSEEK